MLGLLSLYPHLNIILVGGVPTSLKNMKVNWDDYSKYMGKLNMFQTTNQYMYIFCVCFLVIPQFTFRYLHLENVASINMAKTSPLLIEEVLFISFKRQRSFSGLRYHTKD